MPHGAYYVNKEAPEQIHFRKGVRKSKSDELVATAVSAEDAELLVLQVNNYYECTCGAAEQLEKDLVGDLSEEKL